MVPGPLLWNVVFTGHSVRDIRELLHRTICLSLEFLGLVSEPYSATARYEAFPVAHLGPSVVYSQMGLAAATQH